MSDSTELTFGSDVACRDGDCGVLARAIIDPRTGELTHLVVEPRHGRGPGRLAPVALAARTAGGLRLDLTRRDFDGLDEADEQRLPTGLEGGQNRLVPTPFTRGDDIGYGGHREAQTTSSDVVPVGEGEVRRADHVYATDGPIGKIRGLLVQPEDHRLTHVLLEEGHVFERKEVAIPIEAVAGIADGVVLNLTIDQVRELPEV